MFHFSFVWCCPRRVCVYSNRFISCLQHQSASRFVMTSVDKNIGEPTPDEVVRNLKAIKQKIESLSQQHNLGYCPRLVAVSKNKSIELIKACYDAGHRHFGENYVQELIAKYKQLPRDIQWHYIGHLQLNKVKKLIRETWNKDTNQPGLFVIETVDSLELAKALNSAVSSQLNAIGTTNSTINSQTRLTVFVQVNTSGEETKFGVSPNEALALVENIRTQCPLLHFKGLMTIGALKGDPTQDFTTLVRVQQQVCEQLQIPKSEVELSMGMSGDYEIAIAYGSTNLRIGSSIFGERNYNKK